MSHSQGVGAVGILGILYLAMRTERRAAKVRVAAAETHRTRGGSLVRHIHAPARAQTTDFVNFVTAVLNRSPAVVSRSGRVLAGGKYQVRERAVDAIT